jgi:hypothetical protein
MIRAYHMIGLDSADLFRLRNQRITEAEIIQKARHLYNQITQQGRLSAAVLRTSSSEMGHSRQFHLDRLVGDDHYVYLSVGKRYWNTPESTNFGFVFDAEQLLLEEHAILRLEDLMSRYQDLLDDVVSHFAPSRREDEWSQEEVAQLFQALDDPDNTTYVSPNDAYYTLSDAVEYQRLEVPQAHEATQVYLLRAHEIQRQFQLVGEAAVQAIRQEGETGRFELLVKGEIPLSLCSRTIEEGKQK